VGRAGTALEKGRSGPFQGDPGSRRRESKLYNKKREGEKASSEWRSRSRELEPNSYNLWRELGSGVWNLWRELGSSFLSQWVAV
jgi:hypothetical protein